MTEKRDNSGALFKVVPFAPSYEVSADGVVRRRLPGISTFPGKIVKPFVRKDGYRAVTMRHDGRHVVALVHRVVAITFLGEPPSPKHEVAHGDGDRANNNVKNLRWCLHVDNASDMVRHGRSGRGERNVGAVLDEKTVRLLRQRCTQKGDMANLSRELGINYKTIHQAVSGKNWGFVK